MTIVLDDRKLFTDGHHHAESRVKIAVRDVNLWYDHGEKHALKDVNLDVYENEVTAFIGPSGCGKTTLLKCLNRMNDEIPGVVLKGSITMDGEDIYDRHFEPCEYRRRFGWVAQVPNPFAKSIYANVAYGARIHGVVNGRKRMDALVEDCLRRANLWEEVKDRLDESGLSLSGGQQQRLCIARALSTQPEILLMDEPCSALDPQATMMVEELIGELKARHTVIIITHNLQQAARVSQRTAFFHLGNLMESGDTETLFVHPKTRQLKDFVTGNYG